MSEGPASGLVPLLPRQARWPAYALLGAGLALGAARFGRGLKPEALDLKLFAFYSSYFEPRSFFVIEKNVAIELSGVCLLLGLVGVAFAREAVEDELTQRLRARAFVLATAINAGLLGVALLTLFGLGFVYALVANLFSTLALAVVIFRVSLFRARRRESSKLPADGHVPSGEKRE